jgi:LmbE family N-acetylglucosaminyl deacetylase
MRADAVKAALAALPLRPLREIVGGGPLLVLAPHPDDESLGCGGLIAEAVAQGQIVHVAILTDGGGSHPGSRRWPPARLAALRAQEVRRATASLGLPADNLLPLGATDGDAPRDGDAFDALARRLEQLVRSHRITTVLASWRHDPHCDHEAAALLAAEVCRRTGARHLSYPVWTWTLPDARELSGPPPRGARLDITRHLAAKREAIAAHASQVTGLIDDCPDGFRMTAEFMALFERPWEVFVTP